ncbi:MAG: Gfo/Idh/MocA family oxidoreductase [Pirellulales bacterium]|nr:Gfo/Idh/MocA family oxidoreductase [Pirellulales bacterium]
MARIQQFAISRRGFLRSSSAIAAALGLPAWYAQEVLSRGEAAEVKSPNEKLNILLVGCGGQGRGDANAALKFGNVVAVCDVDEQHASAAAKQFQATPYGDFRKAMEHPGVDVVINGTPDHWHTLINIHAMRSGKDVYSEKPLTLTIGEGQKLVQVANETKRILQTGSQQRSDATFRLACELVRNGRIGKLTHILTMLPSGPVQGPFKTAPVPEGLDWDFWQGQAPATDYVPERGHIKFRFWHDYSGGTMTDWGAHHNDIAQWANGTERSGPMSAAGKILAEPIKGGFTTIGRYEVEYEYANGVKHTCKSVARENFYGQPTGETPIPGERNGVKFTGTDGWIFVTRGFIEASDPDLLKTELPASAERLYTSNNHMGNFVECVRTRKPAICEPEIGHRSVSVCHLGVISLRLGRKVNWNPEQETFGDDAEANAFIHREMRKPWSYDAV